VVRQATSPESCITPAATPAGYALDDRPALAGSHEVAQRTGSTTLEIDDREYNDAASVTDTIDSDLVLSSQIERPYQDVQNPGTGQPSSPDADRFPDPSP
jgi:hypothetical protein